MASEYDDPRRRLTRMRERLTSQVTRSRVPGIAAVAMLAVALAVSGHLAQARVDAPEGRNAPVLSPDTIAFATGGGTVVVDVTVVASFGINAKRPDGTFTSGAAQGRINYDKHANITGGRHVNVAVNFMSAQIGPTITPNGTGGSAQIAGNCTDPGAECPPNTAAVLVSVTDASDSGAGTDSFLIQLCGTAGTSNGPPGNCGPAEGGPTLRTGNIQIRSSGPSASGGGLAVTAARAPLRLP
jgi:hypothetical protein